ncbi:MAG: tripartite tricarboxylate transporter substrate binding protein [Alphaproteobacteria bacterium]|nr:tripartite tricarboxylate transporter substrate binding protein [Alphaproteobacteria bacterium]MBV8407717.1 tripartite tricarboxylate transporter substrate binding protein [Alphaproteobacteria bacterium]
MHLGRRAAVLGLGAAGLASQVAHAEPEWPRQPIKIVVPYPPGALTDVLGRLVGERLNLAFGQPVIVDNKPGAATQLGASYVAKQPPDGYTLLLATVSTLSITPALYARPLTTNADFAGVAMLGNVILILVCRPDLPVRDPRELVALLKASPDRYSYGSPGQGTAHHLLVELIRSREGFTATHIPYVGSVKAVVDLAEGRFDFMFLDATVALAQIKAGKLKPLAVTGAKPCEIAPDVPALAEFFPGLDLQPWMSVVAPLGTPGAIAQRLNDEINKAIALPAVVPRLRDAGVEPMAMTLQMFEDFMRSDARRWADLVKLSGAKIE